MSFTGERYGNVRQHTSGLRYLRTKREGPTPGWNERKRKGGVLASSPPANLPLDVCFALAQAAVFHSFSLEFDPGALARLCTIHRSSKDGAEPLRLIRSRYVGQLSFDGRPSHR